MLVLLVDESAGVRARLRERITAETTVVREANDGREACDLAEADTPDVVVLDVHVCAEAGLGLLARLRNRAPAAMIIVLTNEANDIHRRECLRNGADHFLDKSREFDRAVELVVNARASRRALRA